MKDQCKKSSLAAMKIAVNNKTGRCQCRRWSFQKKEQWGLSHRFVIHLLLMEQMSCLASCSFANIITIFHPSCALWRISVAHHPIIPTYLSVSLEQHGSILTLVTVETTAVPLAEAASCSFRMTFRKAPLVFVCTHTLLHEHAATQQHPRVLCNNVSLNTHSQRHMLLQKINGIWMTHTNIQQSVNCHLL